MPKYYKKGLLGQMIETKPDDLDMIEIRLTREEADQYVDQLNQLCRDEDVLKEKLENQKNAAARAKMNYEEKLLYLQFDADQARDREDQLKKQIDENNKKLAGAEQEIRKAKKKIETLRKETAPTIEALEKEKNKNKNLIRILREHANQRRGICPKKDHDGYIVLESRQWTEKYKRDCWDTKEHKKEYTTPEEIQIARKKGYIKATRKKFFS